MNRLLVHGCYDLATLQTLYGLGVRRFGFDLRGQSPNLVPFSHLLELIRSLNDAEATLIFENDKSSTVLSFLDLLKEFPVAPMLEFRDQQPASYYWSLNKPFMWVYHPDAQWKEILDLPQIKGVLLPLKWMEHYQQNPELWQALEGREVEVILHAEGVDQVPLLIDAETSISVDLGREVEKSQRVVDQEKLRRMKLWSQFNESSSL